jgi:Xaa-Pro aminopeptidase
MARIKKALNELGKEGLDAIFLITDANIRYLSGFTGSESFMFLSSKGNFFITDGRYTEQAERECPGFEVIEWKKDFYPLEKILLELSEKYKLNKIAFEQDHLTYKSYKKLENLFSGVELVPTEGLVEKVRYIKEEEEINNIKKAAEIADQVFDQILTFIKPGLTEKRVAYELEYYLNRAGSEGAGFPSILVSGVNTSLPHGIPSDKKIEKGDLVTMDFGGRYRGYPSDMTRTIVVGRADPEQRKIYELVKEAQQIALDAIKAGVKGNIPDEKARKVFAREGLEDKFRHGLGHGVGLEIHESPFMGKTCKDTLREGCVVTVEPGLYIPNWGGVRIEDTVVVRKDGAERLTKSPKELVELFTF